MDVKQHIEQMRGLEDEEKVAYYLLLEEEEQAAVRAALTELRDRLVAMWQAIQERARLTDEA